MKNITLGYKRIFRFAIFVNELMEIAMRESIEMAFSVDAACLSDRTSHIFGALKNIDSRSRKYGELLYVEFDESGKLRFKSLQSTKNVYLMIMVYSRDGKKPMRYLFQDWFMFIDKIKREGLPCWDEQNSAINPILARIPQDTSSL